MRNTILLALCLLVACGDDDVRLDASPGDDAAIQDGGARDAAPDIFSADGSVDAPMDAGTDAVVRMDAGPANSGGSGGLVCERTGTVNSLSYCVITIDGVELKIIEPEDTTGPMDLAIYLHGDGARAYEGDTALRIQAPWTRPRRTLYVAARAPNTCAWWLRPEYTACDGTGTAANIDRDGANADALVSVIRALQAAYDLNYDPILFSGSSGGAVFLTGSFLPLYGDEFHGAFALGCGGFAPYTDFVWETTRDNQGSTYLYFTYGDADVFRGDIEGGIAAYEALDFGMDVELREGGVEHCAFDHIGWVTEVWESYRDGI
ncbi:MAG: putative esterase [Polyangiales bacterium]|jgi:predicted esterase